MYTYVHLCMYQTLSNHIMVNMSRFLLAMARKRHSNIALKDIGS